MFAQRGKCCRQCTGCALANLTRHISELCYKFPVEDRFFVLYVNGHQFGVHKNFEGSDSCFIAADCMASFACMEMVTDASATIYVLTLMKIMMRYDICHTLVVDKDSKFVNVFTEVVDLLQFNCHLFSAQNHNSMLVECINCSLEKGV